MRTHKHTHSLISHTPRLGSSEASCSSCRTARYPSDHRTQTVFLPSSGPITAADKLPPSPREDWSTSPVLLLLLLLLGLGGVMGYDYRKQEAHRKRSDTVQAAGLQFMVSDPQRRRVTKLRLNALRKDGCGVRTRNLELWVHLPVHHQTLYCWNSNMDRLLRLGGGMPGLGQGPPTDAPAVDTAEQVYISSLALLKMLKHGRAGVPMEVMGLMLGEFVDDYTVRVIDVFAMPQSGTGVSVEAVDPVFQAKMLDMLKQTGRPEMVVGWYHSHPGFGCWLSGVDINTQQSFEALSERAVAVVVDPIQSVKGKVVIDAFRLINANMMVLGHEPRQTTSNLGHLNKPSIQALIHGLNRHYYSITINYRKNELEQKMLLNLHKKSWMEGLTLTDYSEHCKLNENIVKEMLELAKNYNKAVEEEDKMTPEQLAIKNVGKQDPKRHLEEHVDVLMTSNIVQCLAAMLDTVVFQ
ncbi:26S proteasome non-ATPase regulatory subunit 14 [Merluccius polli]|uniref:26S proteasome non-ATPase regulatory subunit 14 n=3 Tax=Gadiformes TaxID=8043 RepID=A0AA47M3G5_MERPO|nr:26S proteasome non-ATPase regulatory subunit 14 [Merluccius polli]